MKKLFVDTNIVIDLLAKRNPFYREAANLFSLADNGGVELATSSLTIANTHYVLQRQIDPGKAKQILRKLRLIISILPLNEKLIDLALNDQTFPDFEDALQYFSALEFQQNLIITRNLRDFKQADLPVMTADQFMESLR